MTFYFTKKNTNCIFSSVPIDTKKSKTQNCKDIRLTLIQEITEGENTKGAFFPSHYEMVLNSKLSFTQEFQITILGNIN